MILADMGLSRTRVAFGGAAAATVAASIGITYFLKTTPVAGQAPVAEPATVVSSIGCQGRIEPEDGVLRVTAPYVDGAPGVVSSLKVKENASVAASQVLALLRGADRMEAEFREADARVAAARKRLDQAKDPPKTIEIPAHEAEIRRLEAELAHARTELARYETLRKTDDVSVVEVAAKRATAVSAEHALEESRRRLHSLSEVRPAQVEVAQAEVEVAVAAARAVAARRELYVVRAPAAGRVVRIHAHAGEQMGSEGLLELAKTDRMYAVAEVYEADAPRVRTGQAASITGDALGAAMTGTVERIGSAVAKSTIAPTDPAAFSDRRVVPVHIRLEDASTAARLIHAKVTVAIRP